MEALFIIGLVVFVLLVLRGGTPPEPRVIQIALDPEPPARIGGGWVLICLGVLLVLALLAR